MQEMRNGTDPVLSITNSDMFIFLLVYVHARAPIVRTTVA